MFTFVYFIAFQVCAKTADIRRRWIETFQRQLGCFTLFPAIGGWLGEVKVESEPAPLVIKGLDNSDEFTLWQEVSALLDTLQAYQKAAEQEAVSIWCITPKGLTLKIVSSPEDWLRVRQDAKGLYCEGLALADWFDNFRSNQEVTDDHHNW